MPDREPPENERQRGLGKRETRRAGGSNPGSGLQRGAGHRDKWNELAPILADQGLLTVCDLDTLAVYCATWVRWRDAEDARQREGATITAQSGYQQISPHYTIAKNSLAELRALADRLGPSPSARTRINVQPEGKAEDDLLV